MKKLITATIAILPAIFLPLTTEFYEFNKQVFLALIISLSTGFLIFRYFKSRTISFPVTPLNLPVLVFLAAATLTLVTISPNKWESILYPGGYGTVLLLTIWFFIVLSIWEVKNSSTLQTALLIPSLYLSFLTILQYMGLGVNLIFPHQQWAQVRTWNPTGSPLILLLFLLPIVPMLVLEIIEKVRHDSDKLKAPDMIFKEAGTVVLLITIALLAVQLVLDTRPALLPLSTGWSVTADNLKNLSTAFVGVGQLNYLYAFTLGKSPSYNSLSIWNIRFTTSSNYYLQLMTEVGVLGFIAYVFLMFRVVRNCLKYLKGVLKKNYAYNYMLTGLVVSVLVIFVEQLFLPANFLQLFLLYTLLACISQYMISRYLKEHSNFLFYILSASGLVASIVLLFTAYRSWMAEYYMQRSFYLLQSNKAAEAYDSQRAAIRNNPNFDKLQSVFSRTNMMYAVSLSQKKDLSDNDKYQISNLAAIAAQAGKNAVSLNPYSVSNWENLAAVYRAMLGSVKDADAWTVQSYQQAIRLDSTNPNLYLAMGGVYYAAKNYDTAIEVFARAAALKPNYANAYYNLSSAYKQKQDWQNAAQAMQAALNNVPQNSADRQKAQAELDELKKNLSQNSTSPESPQSSTPPETPAQKPGESNQLENASETENKLNTQIEVNPEQLAPDISPSPSPETLESTPQSSPNPNP